jgi:hypothetical protein
MELRVLPERFSVCKIGDMADIDWNGSFVFVGKTDEEVSLVCTTGTAPEDCVEREDGWRGFRIEGTLDFSLTGIIAKISGLLAENGIGIFVVSTYNTDYVLVKEENLEMAAGVLGNAGYGLIR